MPRFTSHALRRAAVMGFIAVTDAKHASQLTGHNVTTLLRDYVRPRTDTLRQIVAKSGVSRLQRSKSGQVIRLPGAGTVPAPNGAQGVLGRAQEGDEES